jgi:putative hydrolase of the HAD superfamily
VTIRTITIDFWGTLLFDGPGSDNRYKRRRMAEFERILTTHGVEVSAAVLDRAYDASGSFLARVWSTNCDVPAEAHVDAILEAVAPALTTKVSRTAKAALLEAYASPVLVVPPAIDNGAVSALSTLRERGYTLALVSNTMRTPGTTLRKLLDRYGALPYFAHLTFSDEVGVRKPAPQIFHLTLRAVGSAPEEAVHVGDDPILDVCGARMAGMRVVQVTDVPRETGGPDEPDAWITTMAGLPAAIEQLTQ